MVSAYTLLGLAVPEAPPLIEGDGAVEGRHVTGLSAGSRSVRGPATSAT